MTEPRSRFFLLAAVLLLASGAAPGAAADEAHNVRLVGYHHMQGRQALQVTAKSDSANGNWAYIGHVPNTRTGDATLNPITGRNEWNGTSIVDISDPANPELVWHIPNDVRANSRSVSVVYDYEFDSEPPGRDYLIRNSEAGFESQYVHHPIVDEANDRVYAGFRIGSGHVALWDISDPANPTLVWSYDTSPPGRGPTHLET